MRVTRIGYALSIAAAAAVFAGCSGTGSSVAPVGSGIGQQPVMRVHQTVARPMSVLGQIGRVSIPAMGKSVQYVKPDVTGNYVYGCAFFNSVCDIWKLNHPTTLVGTISATSVNAICVDRGGNVWIPDGGFETITEYAKGSTTPIKVLTNTASTQPSGCAVAADGTVYVSNITADTISVFAPGSTTPTSTLTVNSAFSGGTQGSGYVGNVAVDEHKFLIATWENFNTSTSGIDSFAHARQANETTVTSTNGIAGVVFDAAEHIVHTDLGDTDFHVWNGSTTCNSQPAVTPGGGAIFSVINHPNTLIFTGDYLNNEVAQVTFGDCTGGGVLQKVYTNANLAAGTVEGAAVSSSSAL